jgi:hypothetical protein
VAGVTDAVSTPGPAGADDGPGDGRPDPGQFPEQAPACLSEDDLLALLDGLGVAGTHDPEEDQEAIAAAEWQARQAREESGAEDGRAVSAVLVGEHLPAGPGLAAVVPWDGCRPRRVHSRMTALMVDPARIASAAQRIASASSGLGVTWSSS